jgi:hypothetical protein
MYFLKDLVFCQLLRELKSSKAKLYKENPIKYQKMRSAIE